MSTFEKINKSEYDNNEYEFIRLNNGIPMIFNINNSNQLRIEFSVNNSGSNFNTIPGLSNLLAETLVFSSKNYTTSNYLRHLMNEYPNGMIHFDVNLTFMYYYMNANIFNNKDVEKLILPFMDALLHPSFNKKNIQEAINIIDNKYNESLFTNSPTYDYIVKYFDNKNISSINLIGNKKSLNNKDIQQLLIQYYNKYYIIENMVIYIKCNIHNKNLIIDLLNSSFKTFQNSNSTFKLDKLANNRFYNDNKQNNDNCMLEFTIVNENNIINNTNILIDIPINTSDYYIISVFREIMLYIFNNKDKNSLYDILINQTKYCSTFLAKILYEINGNSIKIFLIMNVKKEENYDKVMDIIQKFVLFIKSDMNEKLFIEMYDNIKNIYKMNFITANYAYIQDILVNINHVEPKNLLKIGLFYKKYDYDIYFKFNEIFKSINIHKFINIKYVQKLNNKLEIIKDNLRGIHYQINPCKKNKMNEKYKFEMNVNDKFISKNFKLNSVDEFKLEKKYINKDNFYYFTETFNAYEFISNIYVFLNKEDIIKEGDNYDKLHYIKSIFNDIMHYHFIHSPLNLFVTSNVSIVSINLNFKCNIDTYKNIFKKMMDIIKDIDITDYFLNDFKLFYFNNDKYISNILLSITAKDIIKYKKSFLEKNYANIIIGGNVTEKDSKKIMEDLFKDYKQKELFDKHYDSYVNHFAYNELPLPGKITYMSLGNHNVSHLRLNIYLPNNTLNDYYIHSFFVHYMTLLYREFLNNKPPKYPTTISYDYYKICRSKTYFTSFIEMTLETPNKSVDLEKYVIDFMNNFDFNKFHNEFFNTFKERIYNSITFHADDYYRFLEIVNDDIICNGKLSLDNDYRNVVQNITSKDITQIYNQYIKNPSNRLMIVSKTV